MNNKQVGEAFIHSRLDRAFSSQAWLNLFPEVEFWFGSNDDHTAMFLTLSQMEQGAKPFRLYDSWPKDQEFPTLARTGLVKPICGNGLFFPPN